MRQLFPARGDSPRDLVAARLMALAARTAVQSYEVLWLADEFATEFAADEAVQAVKTMAETCDRVAHLARKVRRGDVPLRGIAASPAPPVPQFGAEVDPPADEFAWLTVNGRRVGAADATPPAVQFPAEVAPVGAVELAEGEADPDPLWEITPTRGEGGEPPMSGVDPSLEDWPADPSPEPEADRPSVRADDQVEVESRHGDPEWDLYAGHPRHFAARVKAATIAGADRMAADLFGRRSSWGVGPALEENQAEVIRAGGFSGHGTGRKILAAVADEDLLAVKPESVLRAEELEAKLAAPAAEEKPKRTRKPRAKKVEPPPVEETIATFEADLKAIEPIEAEDAPGILAPDLEAQLAAESDADAEELPELEPLEAAEEGVYHPDDVEPTAEERPRHDYDVLLPRGSNGALDWIGEVEATDWVEAVNKAAERYAGEYEPGTVLKVRPSTGTVESAAGPRLATFVRECVTDLARWDANERDDCPRCGKPTVDVLDAIVPDLEATNDDDDDLPELADLAPVEAPESDPSPEVPAEEAPVEASAKLPRFLARRNGANLFWLRAADEAQAWERVKIATDRRSGSARESFHPDELVLIVGGGRCPSNVHELKLPEAVGETPAEAAAQAATIEAFREAVPAPAPEADDADAVPGVYAVVQGNAAEASFYIEAESLEAARHVHKKEPLVGDYRVIPMGAGEWERRGETFRECGRYPTNRPDPKRDRPAKPEPADEGLFAPRPAVSLPAVPRGQFRFLASKLDGTAVAVFEAPSKADARKAFAAAYPRVAGHLVILSNCLDVRAATLKADGIPVIPWGAPAPAPTPEPAPVEPPAAPPVEVPAEPTVSPSAEALTIFDAVVWCNGRADLIAHASAPTESEARADVLAKLAKAPATNGIPATVDAPRWLVLWPNVAGIDDVTARQYLARRRVDFCDPIKLKSALTGTTHWIKGEWYDVSYLDGDASGRTALLGRLMAPGAEMAARLAALAFPDLAECGSIYAKPAAAENHAAIAAMGVLEKIELPGGVLAHGRLRDLPKPAEPAPAEVEAAAEESPAAEAEPTPSDPVAPPVEGAPAEVEPDADDVDPGAEEESPTDTDGLLKMALLSPEGAKSDPAIYWNLLRDSGADDDQIRTTLMLVWAGNKVTRSDGEILPGGSIDNGGESCCSYFGGKAPRFFSNRTNHAGGPTLKGSDLIDRIRRVLAIPNEDGTPPAPKGKAGRPPKAAKVAAE